MGGEEGGEVDVGVNTLIFATGLAAMSSRGGTAMVACEITAIESSPLNPPSALPTLLMGLSEFHKYGDFCNDLGGDIGWGYEYNGKLLTCGNRVESNHATPPHPTWPSPPGTLKCQILRRAHISSLNVANMASLPPPINLTSNESDRGTKTLDLLGLWPDEVWGVRS